MVNRRDRRYLVDPSLLFEENPAVAKAEVTVVVTEMGSAVAIRFPSGLGLMNRRDRLGMIATGGRFATGFTLERHLLTAPACCNSDASAGSGRTGLEKGGHFSGRRAH